MFGIYIAINIAKAKEKGKSKAFECRVPKNSKKRLKKSLSQ